MPGPTRALPGFFGAPSPESCLLQPALLHQSSREGLALLLAQQGRWARSPGPTTPCSPHPVLPHGKTHRGHLNPIPNWSMTCCTG